MKRYALTWVLALLSMIPGSAQSVQPIKYGNFDHWVTREIKESGVIGGNKKKVYEIAPTNFIAGNKAYRNQGGSPWATSNVYAKVAGISKASNAVFPVERPGHGKCAKLCTMMESVKVLNMVNMDVLVAGSIFLGEMIEPITGTKNPMQKMEMGVPYSKRPSALTFDYKLEVPDVNNRIKSTGFSSKSTLPGRDASVVFVLLQKRWEDKAGNIHALRVGTGGHHFSKATGWVNGYRVPIVYGNTAGHKELQWLGLRTGNNRYYARNSKGKMVPVTEDGWGDADDTPTHVIVMISSAKGEPYVGTLGMTFYVDNVAFAFH